MVTLRTLAAAVAVPVFLLASSALPGAEVTDPDVVLAARTCSYPAQVLNLTNWKVTLPVGPVENPTTVGQPQLASYKYSPWFTAQSNCDGVNFAAPVNGVTTAGSAYPRSELREMTNNGKDNASWSSSTGTHKISVTEAFVNTPQTKPHVVGLQIHDALDDISVFRLEGTTLYVTNGDNTHFFLVTGKYKLGTKFTAGYEVSGDTVKAVYNGKQVVTFPAVFTGAYFKAGAYTQANCTNSTPCSAVNFGSTRLYALAVTHTVTVMQQISGGLRSLFGLN